MPTTSANMDFWKQLVDEFQQAGVTQAEFAAAHDLTPSKFRYWLQKVRRERTAELGRQQQEREAILEALNRDLYQRSLHPITAERLEAIEGRLRTFSTEVEEILGDGHESVAERLEDLAIEIHDLRNAHYDIGEVVRQIRPLLEGELFELAYERVKAEVDNLVIEAVMEGVGASGLVGYDHEINGELMRLPQQLDKQQGQLGTLRDRLVKLERLVHRAGRDDRLIDDITIKTKTLQRKGERLRSKEIEVQMTASELRNALLERGFYLELKIATEILDVLRRRRILVLEGVPGTGKTTLARLLPEVLLPGAHIKHKQVSGFPEATVADSIGSLRMIGKRFAPSFGWLTEAVLRSVEYDGAYWLILDEMNRCDMSALFAPALDALEPRRAGHIDHPRLFPGEENQSGLIPVPGAFRVIGTVNPFDKDQLFQFTSALDRRIGVVRIPPVVGKAEMEFVERRLLQNYGVEGHQEARQEFMKRLGLSPILGMLFGFVGGLRDLCTREPRDFFEHCQVGTGLVLEMAEMLCERRLDRAEATPTDLVDEVISEVVLKTPGSFGRPALLAIRDELLHPNEFSRSIQAVDDFVD